MIGLITFFGTIGGRLALGAGLIAALVGLRAWDVSHQRKVGAHLEAVRVETVGKQIDAKAQKKRERVERAPAPQIDADLLKYCRDCGTK